MPFLQHRWFPYLMGALFVCLALALAATKSPWCDEGWFANAAYNLANHGHMGSNLQEPSGHYLNAYLRGIQERTYLVPPVYLVTLAGWLKIWGNGLLAMRAYAILWGLVTLGVFGLLVTQLTGDRLLATVATLLTAMDFTFLFVSTDVRMESMVIGLSLGSWAAYLHWRESDLRRAVLVSHTLLALACFSHPNAALFGVGWLYLFWRHDRQRASLGLLLWSMLPYAILGLAWGVYIAESPRDFMAQFFANAGESHRFKFLFRPWMNVGLEVAVRYLGHFGMLSIWAQPMPWFMVITPLTYLAGLVGCARKAPLRTKLGDLWPLTLIIVGQLALLVSYKAQNYVSYTIPVWNLLIATWLLYGLNRRRAQIYFVLFAGIQLTCLASRVKNDGRGTEYARTARLMQEQMRLGHSLIAPSSMGFDAGFAGFTDDARLGRWSGQRPDIVVVDHWYALFHASYREREPGVSRYVKSLLSEEYAEPLQYGQYKIYTRKRLMAHQETR